MKDEFFDGDNIKIHNDHTPDDGVYCYFTPVRINTINSQKIECVTSFSEHEIYIDESDSFDLLMYFLYKHFNIKNGFNEKDFTWITGCNYYTLEEIKSIINDINGLVYILKTDPTHKTILQSFPKKCIDETNIDLAENILDFYYSIDGVIHFYKDFVQYLSNMINNCKDCNAISFEGP